tara:strand:- start:162 stop:464 length:303 start_codon:yes stop_codon:yes gene_type:complete
MNKNSLGEMTKEAVNEYIAHITRATRRYFFHMNHEIKRSVFSNGNSGLLGSEYPIPMDQYTLLFRYPDMGNMLAEGFIDFASDIFIYLYGRKSQSADGSM